MIRRSGRSLVAVSLSPEDFAEANDRDDHTDREDTEESKSGCSTPFGNGARQNEKDTPQHRDDNPDQNQLRRRGTNGGIGARPLTGLLRRLKQSTDPTRSRLGPDAFLLDSADWAGGAGGGGGTTGGTG